MISKRTCVWFVLTVLLWGAAGYRARQDNRACREWRQAHASEQTNRARQPGGEETAVALTPCASVPERTGAEQLLVVCAFVSLIASLIDLAQDLRRR